jgi:hypothetical protein
MPKRLALRIIGAILGIALLGYLIFRAGSLTLLESLHRLGWEFRKLEKDSIKTVDGWTGLLEDVCAPADEVDIFDKLVRDPAGGVKK